MLNRKVEIITTGASDQLEPPSLEQNAVDPDDVELDEAWFKRAKPTSELFPEAHEQAVRREAALQAGLIENVSITLDRETIDWYKAQTGENGETGGTAWLTLIEEAVRFYALVATPGPGTGPYYLPVLRGEAIEELVPRLRDILRLVDPSGTLEQEEHHRTADR